VKERKQKKENMTKQQASSYKLQTMRKKIIKRLTEGYFMKQPTELLRCPRTLILTCMNPNGI